VSCHVVTDRDILGITNEMNMNINVLYQVLRAMNTTSLDANAFVMQIPHGLSPCMDTVPTNDSMANY
jgi:hypothetical protein